MVCFDAILHPQFWLFYLCLLVELSIGLGPAVGRGGGLVIHISSHLSWAYFSYVHVSWLCHSVFVGLVFLGCCFLGALFGVVVCWMGGWGDGWLGEWWLFPFGMIILLGSKCRWLGSGWSFGYKLVSMRQLKLV